MNNKINNKTIEKEEKVECYKIIDPKGVSFQTLSGRLEFLRQDSYLFTKDIGKVITERKILSLMSRKRVKKVFK